MTEAPPLAIPAPPSGAPAIRVEVDPGSGYTRHSVTTHSGVYTGWVQKPQITFFALTAGAASPARLPQHIGLIFRTLEPEAVLGTRLVLGCPDLVDSIGLAAGSHVVPTGNTHSHFLTYMVPTARLAAFAACSEGTLTIGQLQTRFTAGQLGGIRALLLHLGATPEARAP